MQQHMTFALVSAALACFAAAAAIPLAARLARVWNRSGRFARYVFLAGVVGATLYGGAKSGRVSYPFTDPETRYLVDAGSYVTNDCVHVSFTRSPLVPAEADLVGYARPAGSTNDAAWVQMLDTTFAAFPVPSDIPYPGAQTNDFAFFTTWTPGPVVHTNGVAVILWQRPYDGATNRMATIRTGIYLDGRRVAPNPAITNGPSIRLQSPLNGSYEND